jgi:hypothetical protein
MPKAKSEQAEAQSLITPQAEERTAAALPDKTAKAKTAEKDRLYTPKAREKKPSLLTADQYLKTAGLKEGIAALARSLYGNKIMSEEEWKITISSLLKRRMR